MFSRSKDHFRLAHISVLHFPTINYLFSHGFPSKSIIGGGRVSLGRKIRKQRFKARREIQISSRFKGFE